MRRALLVVLGVPALALLAVAQLVKDDPYLVRAEFANAGGLRKDFYVKIGGVKVGHVERVDLTARDTARVTMRVEDSALPIGRDASAEIRPSSLLGEHVVHIDPGDLDDPLPSGGSIAAGRTSNATAYDQVLSAFDASTQAALGVFLAENGDALLGRGEDLGTAIEMLPRTLSGARELVRDLAADNTALGRLIDASDRVLAPIVAERRTLGRLVGTSEKVLDSLARERGPLGRLLSDAAPALKLVRDNLQQVRASSRALRESADGIRNVSAPLRANLEHLEPFVDAVAPLLREVRRAAPTLRRLGTEATPIVRRLVPTSRRFATFADRLDSVSDVVEILPTNLLAYMEGKARASVDQDLLGHIYYPLVQRPSNEETARMVRSMLLQQRRASKRKQKVTPSAPTPPLTAKPQAPAKPGVKAPKLDLPKAALPAPDLSLPGELGDILDYLLAP